MKKLIALVRSGVEKSSASGLQLVGAAGISWGLWEQWPWAGKVAGGVLALLFGVARELGRGES